MMQKTLKVFILLIFINYTFIGCSVIRIRQLSKIQPKEKIRNVIKPSGDKIRFDYKGGYHYLLEAPAVAGITKNGFWAIIRMRDVKEIRTTNPKITKSKKQLRNQKIIELVTLNYDVVQFDSAGGIYDDSDKTIKGLNQIGKEETYKLNTIIGCRIVPPDIVSKDSLKEHKDLSIAEVVTGDQKLIIFDRRGGMFVEASNVLVGYTMKGSLIRLNRDQVDIVYVNHPMPIGTLIIGSSLVVLFVWGFTTQSAID